MCIGSIRHVDIIADAGAVRRFIVVAVDGHCRPVTRGSEHARDQMRFRIVHLPGGCYAELSAGDLPFVLRAFAPGGSGFALFTRNLDK